MGQITATRNLVATKVVRLAGQKHHNFVLLSLCDGNPPGTSQRTCHVESVTTSWHHRVKETQECPRTLLGLFDTMMSWRSNALDVVRSSARTIGKTPVRIILWCPRTKMLIKVGFRIQPLEQEGGCQKCCISLYSKVFINHFYPMKACPECLNILIYWRKYWVDRLRGTLRRKV